MSKKVLVLSKELEGADLKHIGLERACRAYSVPAGLIDIASVMIPEMIGIDGLSLDVPKFDKKGNSLEIVLHKKKGDEEHMILKLNISFDEKKAHEMKLSTDGGNTWKEISYKSDSEAPVEAVPEA